jgi:hypothetical protein
MTTRDGPVLDVDAIAGTIAADPDLCERLCAEYGLPKPASADEFVSSLVEAFDQRPHEDPVDVDRSPRDVFRAAVRSLGSNSRAWTSFLRREPELAVLLENYDPDAVRRKVAKGRISAEGLLDFFPGQTGRTDARSAVAWARRASTRDFDREVRALAGALSIRCREVHGEEIGTDHLMPTLVAFLAYPPGSRWPGYAVLRVMGVTDDPAELKLPGMGPALSSEFFRNLGWSGFKPDRHIMRLLDRWAPEVVAAQRPVARRLAKVVGRRDRGTLDYLAYSLAGQELTPEGTHFSVADNLVWALGAYVEKKGRETGRSYLRDTPT